MKNPSYWKRYPVETSADEIERSLTTTRFASNGQSFDLIRFENGPSEPCVLISPGSGGHGYVFAELGYRIHAKGYNVFIMPAHGGHTITELVQRHSDAVGHIANVCNANIGIFGEGLGGYAIFYLALAGAPVRSIVCQNAPAILTEPEWRDAMLEGKGAALRRRLILPLAELLVKIAPKLKLPISLYLDFAELVDTKTENRRVETRIVEAYARDPDFVVRYPLSAIMSLLSTPPPKPLDELQTPTMFLLPVRGFVPSYFRSLFARLPPIEKKLVEVNGSVFWMVSHPREAADIICGWFAQTLARHEPVEGDS